MYKKFNRFYRKYENFMYHIAYAVLKDSYLAEDAVQTAFINMFKVFQGIGDIEDTKTRHFVMTVTRRVAIDIYRKQQKQNARELPIENIDMMAASAEANSATETTDVMECVKKLPKKYADTLILKYTQGYKTKEIAEIFGYAPGTIRSYLFRGKKRLLEELKRSGIDIKPKNKD